MHALLEDTSVIPGFRWPTHVVSWLFCLLRPIWSVSADGRDSLFYGFDAYILDYGKCSGAFIFFMDIYNVSTPPLCMCLVLVGGRMCAV